MLTTLPKLNRILDYAAQYEGCVEGDSTHSSLVQIYNSIKPLPRGYRLKLTDAWCAAYVSVIMYRAGITSFPYECGVGEMFKKLTQQGCVIYGRPPMPGEILFFRSSHVGIVCGWVENNWDCATIEGNTADQCLRRKHNLQHNSILGWASPYRYSSEEIHKQIEGGVWGPAGADRDYILQINGYAS